MNRNKLKIIILFIFITLGLISVVILFKKINSNSKENTNNSNVNNTQEGSIYAVSKEGIEKNPNSNETFEELTIPYLRDRNYQSSLSEIQKISENGNYTSYLTSYTSDGLKINGLLTMPKGEKPEKGWPAIVFVHGYIPPQEYETTKNYVSYVDYLAKNGFIVFKIDLRGHGKSEGEPGGAYYSSGYVIDVLNAQNALKSSDFVNPDNIGLWGHSMGGNVIFRAFVAKKDIKAVSIWAGAVYTYKDFSDYGIRDNSYRSSEQETESRRKRNALIEKYGNFDPNSEFWKKIVPTNYLDSVKGAVQINHAVDDEVVSIEYTRNLSSILLETDIVHEINEYPSGGHNINGPSFEKAMENTVRFFKTFLIDN